MNEDNEVTDAFENRDDKGIMIIDYVTNNNIIVGSLLEASLLTKIPKYEIYRMVNLAYTDYNRLVNSKYMAGYEFFYLTDIGSSVPEPMFQTKEKAIIDRDGYLYSLENNMYVPAVGNKRKPHHDDFVIFDYNTDGSLDIKVRLNDGTVWLSQKQIGIVFEKDASVIGKHTRNIYEEGELLENQTKAFFALVQKEGEKEVSRDIPHYNLDMIISVGYRVNSKKATKFRQWATKVLSDRVVKGFSIDTERLVNDQGEYGHELDTSINAIRASERNAFNILKNILTNSCGDFSFLDDKTEKGIFDAIIMFYAKMMNKFLVAATNNTATEIVSNRFDKTKPMFGLISSKQHPPEQTDFLVGINYLTKEEMQIVNLLVNTFLHLAKLQVKSNITYTFEYWLEKIDSLVISAGRPVLDSGGLINREELTRHVLSVLNTHSR